MLLKQKKLLKAKYTVYFTSIKYKKYFIPGKHDVDDANREDFHRFPPELVLPSDI